MNVILPFICLSLCLAFKKYTLLMVVNECPSSTIFNDVRRRYWSLTKRSVRFSENAANTKPVCEKIS